MSTNARVLLLLLACAKMPERTHQNSQMPKVIASVSWPVKNVRKIALTGETLGSLGEYMRIYENSRRALCAYVFVYVYICVYMFIYVHICSCVLTRSDLF